METIIKLATIDDAKEIHRIHTDAVIITCKNCYTDTQINARIEGRLPEGYHDSIVKNEIYIAKNNDNIVGFGFAIPGEIIAIFVDPVFHNKGIGKLLLDHGLKIASKNQKIVKVESTVNAESFYKKYGFIKIKDSICIKRGNVQIPTIILEYSIKNNENIN